MGHLLPYIVPLKQNKLFPLFTTFTLRYMSYLVSSVLQRHGVNEKKMIVLSPFRLSETGF